MTKIEAQPRSRIVSNNETELTDFKPPSLTFFAL